jgi:hypothetical protein
VKSTWALLLSSLCLLVGCSSYRRSAEDGEEKHHVGPKVNVEDFATNTGAYKGRLLSLNLTVIEEPIVSKERSLADYVGREVKFALAGPKQQRWTIQITIPEGAAIPKRLESNKVFVTFFCNQGSLNLGNQAKRIAAD